MGLKLEIKTWASPDVELYHWIPENRSEVKFLLEMEIGVVGEAEMDIFQVVVATPEGLRARASGDVVSERATLVLADYSLKLLQETCASIVERCTAATWDESVLRLQRYFQWEYEDYK